MDNITDEIRLADMTETSNEASFHKPTRRERFWRAIGFRYHFTDLPEGIHEDLPGWMMTKSFIHFSVADRLRLLLTGRIYMDMRQATNVAVAKACSALSFRIAAPGDKGDSHD